MSHLLSLRFYLPHQYWQASVRSCLLCQICNQRLVLNARKHSRRQYLFPSELFQDALRSPTLSRLRTNSI